MALHILRRAYVKGRLRPGDTIAEATSGNTGIAFAALGRALGYLRLKNAATSVYPVEPTESPTLSTGCGLLANGFTSSCSEFSERVTAGSRHNRLCRRQQEVPEH
jgi:cysteine synthase